MSERLVQTVHKLEDKIRQLRTEQKETEQRLELASLDKELAEEKVRVVENELASLKKTHDASTVEHTAKLAELKELTQINAELEEIWQQREKELERLVHVHQTNYLEADREITRLKEQLQQPIAQNSQQTEALRLEIEHLKLRLKGAEQELDMQKRGLFVVLGELSEWSPLIKYASCEDPKVLVEAERLWSEYRDGKITLKGLDTRLADLWTEFDVPEQPALVAVLEFIKASGGNVGPELENRARNGAFVPGDIVRPFLVEGRPPPVDVLEKALVVKIDKELESAQARIAILESKVARARDLALELGKAEERETAAQKERILLNNELAAARTLAQAKDEEMGRLRRAQLPNSLESADAQQKLKSMQSALTFLASERSGPLSLDPLNVDPPVPPSLYAGHPRVSAIRRALNTFEMAESPREAGQLAIRQNAQLYKLFS